MVRIFAGQLVPLIDADAAPARHRPVDEWRTRRIWICGAIGAWLAGSRRLLDFWPLGVGGGLRTFIDLSELLLVLPVAASVVGLLIVMGVASWRRHVRRAASSLLAVAALPICVFAVARLPLFDPWLWYVIANESRFEELAASRPSNEPTYEVLDSWDVSVGFAGVNLNHFVALIYDKSGAVGLEPSERPANWRTTDAHPFWFCGPVPKGRRLHGHFFRVDCFY